jgi:hypothetical protein
VARSRGSGRIRYRLQYRHTVRTRISTIITIGPILTGLRGTQLTGSIIYTLVNKTSTLLVKLNITKAFDLVRWDYILDIMQRHGFPPRWCAWVALILSMLTSKVLLNGILGKQIFMDVAFGKVTPSCRCFSTCDGHPAIDSRGGHSIKLAVANLVKLHQVPHLLYADNDVFFLRQWIRVSPTGVPYCRTSGRSWA